MTEHACMCFLLIVVEEMISGSVERPLYFHLFKQQTFCPLFSECQTLLLVPGAQRRWRQAHSGFIHCFFCLSESPSTHISVWHPPMLHSGFLYCHLLQEGFPDHRSSKESLFLMLFTLLDFSSQLSLKLCYISTYQLICFHLFHQN